MNSFQKMLRSNRTTFNASVVVCLGFALFVYAQEDNPGTNSDNGKEQSRWLTAVLNLCEWTQNQGIFGIAVYTMFLALAVVCGLPCTPLETLPGFLYGFRTGFLVAFAGKNLGNFLSVILAKTVFQNYVVTKILPKYKVLQVFDIVAKRNGFVAVLLFRGFVYAPMLVKNYGLAAVGIPISHLTMASFITGSPYSAWWAYLGSTANSIVQIMDGENIASPFQLPENKVFAALILAIIVVFWGWLIKVSREAWKEAETELEKTQSKAN
eukprot:m.339450 g.339450  ORF g.339450 m.339450 type:complete len:267 (+) comp18808_c0_seq1:269-1069(+)